MTHHENLDQLCINTIRTLAMDGIQKANSGNPGLPMGAAAMAASMGALSADHLEHIDERGVRALAANGTTAVLLPGAFYFLREKQLPPVDLFRRDRVPMAVATDCNPGSSPCLSILTILNMSCTLFRLSPEEALAGVTINAAKALGIQSTVGSIEAGKKADLVLWDVDAPAELSYYLGHNPCRTVIKNGTVVICDGVLLSANPPCACS